MTPIPESHQDILDKRAFAHVATVDAEGNPQVTPVWVSFDGEYVLINSAKGRKKDRNLRERPNVALSIQDPENPYRYLGIQGVVVGDHRRRSGGAYSRTGRQILGTTV